MGRVAVVTGGTRGIGEAISLGLKNAGYTVVATYAGNVEKANAFTEATGIHTYKFDVGDFDSCASAVAQITADVGAVEVLVNNAGITRDTFIHKMTPDMWNDVIQADLTSLYNMCHAVIPAMREAAFGRIINISSINGVKGQLGQTNYSAAKAGMIGFSKALAQEVARKGVTVNCIAPGYVNTEMVAAVPEKVLEGIIAQIPVGRLGAADEIARCVTFLAADESGFITGETINANGGMYMH